VRTRVFIYVYTRAERYPEFKRGAAEIFASGFRDVSFFALYASFWLQWISGGYNATGSFCPEAATLPLPFFSFHFSQTFKTSAVDRTIRSPFRPTSAFAPFFPPLPRSVGCRMQGETSELTFRCIINGTKCAMGHYARASINICSHYPSMSADDNCAGAASIDFFSETVMRPN